MRVGSLVFATEQGLGYLARAFYQHNIVTDVLVIQHGRRPEQDWYYGAQRITSLVRQQDELRAFCERMDGMLFFETPFDWTLLDWCRQCRVKTVLSVMHECMPKMLPALPDLFLCPSLLDLQWAKRSAPVPSLFLPVPVEVPWRLREKAEVFVHNAGWGGLKGRNGTAELLEAVPYLCSEANLIVRTQGNLLHLPGARDPLSFGTVRGGLPRLRFEGYLPYHNLWTDGDVFVFPERFNGLSLPLQEARGAGMLVMASDRFPMNTWLPREPLLPVTSYRKQRVARRCAEFDEAVLDPKAIAATIDAWYGKDISAYSLQGKAWAEANSWEVMGPRYREVLEGL